MTDPTAPAAPDPLADARQLLAERDRARQLLAEAERQAIEAEQVAVAAVRTRDAAELQAAEAVLGLAAADAAPVRQRYEKDIAVARKQVAAARDQADAAHRLVEAARARLAALDGRVRPVLDAAIVAHQAACDTRMTELEARYRAAAEALRAVIAEVLALATAGGTVLSVGSSDPWSPTPERISLIGEQVQQARLWELVVPAPFATGTHHGNLLEGREIEPGDTAAFKGLTTSLEALRALATWQTDINNATRTERSKAPSRAA